MAKEVKKQDKTTKSEVNGSKNDANSSKISTKKNDSIRERAVKAQKRTAKPKRAKAALLGAARPFKAAHRLGKKEYYLPLPKNKLGKWLNKRRSVAPRYLINAFKELGAVKWPGAKETTKLTIAVFIFALTFGTIIALVDYGLDIVFKKVIL